MADSKDEWQKRKQFEGEGIDVKPWRGLQAEHQNLLAHEFVKFTLTRAIYEVGHKWDSEVRFPNGREADIVDLGPEGGKPVVYEVETDPTPKRIQEKLDHFHIGPVRDVIVIDPSDVPADVHAAVEYLLANEVIG